jgi:iron complex outermembrane receptor protein
MYQPIKSLISRTIPASLVLFLLPGATYLAGQEEEADEDVVTLQPFDVLEDAERRGYQSNLIIGANRMVIPTDEMATSAFVINSEFIEDHNPRYLTEVTKYVAGVGGTQNYTTYDSIQIRSNETGSALRDGFPADGLAYVPMSLVEQIEVIKGPQGVLYGQISAGGFFNRVMKKPQFEKSGEIRLEIGSWDFYGGMIDVTGPISESNKNIAYRFIGSVRTGGGRQANLSTDRPDNTIAGGFTIALPGGGNWTVMADYNDRETSFADEVVHGDERTGLPDFELHKSFNTYNSLATPSEQFRISSILEKNIGPVDTRFSYQYSDFYWNDDALLAWCICDEGPQGARFREFSGQKHVFFVDAVWQPQFGDFVKNVVNFGYSYSNGEGADLQIVNFALDPADYPRQNIHDPMPRNQVFNHGSANNNLSRDATSFSDFYSLYGNWRASFADERISLIAGVRYQNYTKGARSLLPDATDNPDKSDDTTLFRYGVTFKVTEGVNLWASYGETFNISSTLAPTREGETIVFLPDPGAENIEGGVKLSLWERKLNLTLAYYELSQTGRTKSGSSSLIPIVAVPDATNTGFEFQLTAEPVPGWNVIASLTDQTVTTASGERDTDIAEFYANFWTKYTILEGSMRGLGAGFGISHIGDKLPFALPTNGAGVAVAGFKVPAITTIDAAVSFDRGPWRFAFNATNLADKLFMRKTSGSFGAHWISNGRVMTFSTSYRW